MNANRAGALLTVACALTGCGGVIGVSSSYMRSIVPVVVPVEIPRSSMKTMRVYVHPSLTRAFVAPLQREATAESLSNGVAGWAARASELVPAYRGALETVLRDRGVTCTASQPVALSDTFGYEFSLACEQQR